MGLRTASHLKLQPKSSFVMNLGLMLRLSVQNLLPGPRGFLYTNCSLVTWILPLLYKASVDLAPRWLLSQPHLACITF